MQYVAQEGLYKPSTEMSDNMLWSVNIQSIVTSITIHNSIFSFYGGGTVTKHTHFRCTTHTTQSAIKSDPTETNVSTPQKINCCIIFSFSIPQFIKTGKVHLIACHIVTEGEYRYNSSLSLTL